MKRIASSLMLIFLTACSGSNDAPVPSAAQAAPPVVEVAQNTADAGTQASFIVYTTPSNKAKAYTPSEKLAARAQARSLLDLMLDLEHSAADTEAMRDPFRYWPQFARPLDNKLAAWPKSSDASWDLFGDLNYCSDSGRALAVVGGHVNNSTPQQFVAEAWERYRIAVSKCAQAIQKYR